MALSVLLVVLMVLLYELIKLIKLKTQYRVSVALAAPAPNRELLLEADRSSINSATTECSPPNKWWILLHAGASLLHVVQVVLGYALMLCVMTYNSWIFLGIIIGSAIGYFLLFPMQLEAFRSCQLGGPADGQRPASEIRVRTGDL